MARRDDYLELTEAQKRQYIDAEVVFRATAQAKKTAREVRGSMIWRELRGVRKLIRTSARGAQKTVGPESAQTRQIYDGFMSRKAGAEARLKALRAQLLVQQRLNRALRVGRVPNIVVDVINVLAEVDLDQHFVVVGTHALYAYESAAAVRFTAEAMATRDVDMLFDTRKRLAFFTAMDRLDSSLIGLLHKVDRSFEVVADQHYTARNNDGFEVDIIRREAGAKDPHPMRMSRHEDDFWAVQVSMGERLLGARPFSQVVVATSGAMAMMHTVHPLDFARIKLALSRQKAREATKRGKDVLQARIVRALVDEHLPQLKAPA